MSGGPHVPNEAQLLEEFGFVRRLALSLVRDPHLADDLAQQTYVVALEGRTTPHGPPRAWLAGIVRNLARMSWRSGERRTRRETVAARPEPIPSAAEDAVRLEAQERLVRAVRELPDEMRATVVLRYLEDQSLPTIAERMKISVRAVESRLRRARARLREKLSEVYGDRKSWLPALCVIAGVKMPAKEALAAATGTGVLIMSAKTKLVLATALALFLVTAAAVPVLWPAEPTDAPDVEPEVVPVADVDSPPADRRGGADDRTAGPAGGSATGTTPDRPSAPRSAQLHGVVLDAEELPVAGATVSIRSTHVRVGLVTDGAGRFVASKLPTGPVRVTHTPQGAKPVQRLLELAPGRNEVRLDLPPTEELRVLVVDPLDRPVNDASITLYQLSNTALRGRTGVDGKVVFQLENGFRDLGVYLPDKARQELYMPALVTDPPEGGSLVIRLRYADHVEGILVDQEDKPVSRSHVDVLVGGKSVTYGVTDDEGRFRIPVPKGATLTLVARGSRAPRGKYPVDLFARGRRADVDAASKDVVLKMSPVVRDRSLTCEVRGPLGRPLPGAKVAVRSPHSLHKIQEETADSNGVVRFRNLPAIELKVFSWSYELPGGGEDWSVPSVPRVFPEGQTIVLRFRESRITTGTLSDHEGKPVAGCRVQLTKARDRGETVLATDRTDEEGRFRLLTPAEEPGPFRLVSHRKTKDGAESLIRLPGVDPGERDMEIAFGR